MKTYLISIFFFLLGAMEYLPIPNLPGYLTEGIQMASFFLPILGLIGIIALRLLRIRNWLQIPLIFVLLIFQFYSSFPRSLANRLTVAINNDLPPEETTKIIAGTSMTQTKNRVTFNWHLLLNDYEVLVYQPDHGFKTNRSSREIIEVINENWYVQKTGRLE